IKLTVSNGICTDSSSAPIRVYPGFKANFDIDGSCIQIPFNFKDKSQSRYGTINKWYWKFNDPNQLDDTSNLTNPSYLYKNLGNFSTKLIIQNTYGCIDSLIQSVIVNDKPNLKLSFRDTLICSIDSLVLQSNNIGTMQWSPNYNMLNATSNTPTVFPKRTTTYKV
ncbi:PKD domain-containing protein, partial [Bacillus pumilus]|uniref:PKD domain-containing protein n=1 Tax=Bacillus pumilus TaxID=1408 RepID=UPI0033162025